MEVERIDPFASVAVDKRMFPFEHLVPRGYEDNMLWRKGVLVRARWDVSFQQVLWTMCSRDMLFWVNGFCWAFDPRKVSRGDNPTDPFITWPKQEEWIETLIRNLGGSDILIKKPRDKGGSWLPLLLYQWRWLFSAHAESFLLMSRKEGLVDGQPNSLFDKLDHNLGMLPSWMRPEYDRTKLNFENKRNRCVITGESTTSATSIGDRRTSMMLDEFGKMAEADALRNGTRDVTRCRIFVSTPYPEATVFHDMWTGSSGAVKIEPRWYDDPRNLKGWYYDKGGELRSEVYDREKAEREPRDFQSNFLGEFLGEGTGYFSADVMDRARGSICEPFERGTLMYDMLTGEPKGWQPDKDGRTALWMTLTPRGTPPESRKYVVGCDVSWGSGASNSVIVVLDGLTGEKVYEFVDSKTGPMALALLAMATARWFNNGYLIWERNGGGVNFSQTVAEKGYSNVYWHKDEERAFNRRPTDKMGWYTTKESKKLMLGAYKDALWEGRVIERSHETLMECRNYVYGKDGPISVKAIGTIDPSGANEAHGDRVIATALATWAFIEMGGSEAGREREEEFVGSNAWCERMEERFGDGLVALGPEFDRRWRV